jgi:hypothetical protein
MNNNNIFDIAIDLREWGLAYCLWRGHSLWEIFVAYNINRKAY